MDLLFEPNFNELCVTVLGKQYLDHPNVKQLNSVEELFEREQQNNTRLVEQQQQRTAAV